MIVKGNFARIAAAGAAATMLGTFAISTPALAADLPQTLHLLRADSGLTFRLTYGASILDVTATFSNRTVDVRGSIKAVSADRTVLFEIYNPDGSCVDAPETRTAPVGTAKPYHFTTPYCDVAGGYSAVDVSFPINL